LIHIRYKIIGGKPALGALRDFYRKTIKQNLSDQNLVSKLVELELAEVKEFIEN
jgi:hypothetical protein